MLHTYVQRFDVMKNFEKNDVLEETKQAFGLLETLSMRQGC